MEPLERSSLKELEEKGRFFLIEAGQLLLIRYSCRLCRAGPGHESLTCSSSSSSSSSPCTNSGPLTDSGPPPRGQQGNSSAFLAFNDPGFEEVDHLYPSNLQLVPMPSGQADFDDGHGDDEPEEAANTESGQSTDATVMSSVDCQLTGAITIFVRKCSLCLIDSDRS